MRLDWNLNPNHINDYLVKPKAIFVIGFAYVWGQLYVIKIVQRLYLLYLSKISDSDSSN